MLLRYGDVEVSKSWIVDEKSAPFFSRFYYVFSGEVSYFSNKTECKLKAGYLYCFPSNIPYKVIQNPDNPLICIYLHLDLSPLLISELIEIDASLDDLLKSILNTIRLSMEGMQGNTFNKLVSDLSFALVTYLNNKKYLEDYDGAICESLRLISQNLSENLSIEQLSQSCGYNSRYFIRLFKKQTGLTPHQYIICYRMRKALYYLQLGYSVTETAVNVGYPDLKNFSRAFKKQFGISPIQVSKYIKLNP